MLQCGALAFAFVAVEAEAEKEPCNVAPTLTQHVAGVKAGSSNSKVDRSTPGVFCIFLYLLCCSDFGLFYD